MNQSVLFPDLQSWCTDKQQMVFPVQVEAVTLFCVIGLSKLAEISGEEKVDADNVLAVFLRHRFDIEDLAEQQLADEVFDIEGHVYLG